MDLEILASGYALVEGPRVDEHDRLYFADVIPGGIFRRNPDGRIEDLIPGRKHIGGMAFNEAGGLVLCGKGGLVAWDEKTRAHPRPRHAMARQAASVQRYDD